ncbi:MAG: hypothetical protein ABH869_03430 [Candidatus Omnitrophota bacterium]
MKKICSIVISAVFLINNFAYGLGTIPASLLPEKQKEILAGAGKRFAVKRGDGAIDWDKFTGSPENFIGEAPEIPEVKFKKAEYEKLIVPGKGLVKQYKNPPKEWKNNPILEKTDLIEAFTYFRDNEARIPEKFLEIKEGYFKVDEQAGELPICRLENHGEDKYVLVVHTKFVQMWNHIRANDIWFEFTRAYQKRRIASLAWGIFYRIAKHEMTDLAESGSGKSSGHIEAWISKFVEEGEGSIPTVEGDERKANQIYGGYNRVNESAWLWFLGAYAFADTTRYNNNTLNDRLNWFFGDEVKELAKQDPGKYDFSEVFAIENLYEDEVERNELINGACALNYHFFSQKGVKVPEFKVEQKYRTAYKKRRRNIIGDPLYMGGSSEKNKFLSALEKLTIPADESLRCVEMIDLIEQFAVVYSKEEGFLPISVNRGELKKQAQLFELGIKVSIFFDMEKILAFASQKQLAPEMQNKLKTLISAYIFEGINNVPDELKDVSSMETLEYMKEMRLCYGTKGIASRKKVLLQRELNQNLMPGLQEKEESLESESLGRFYGEWEVQEKIAELYFSGQVKYIVFVDSLQDTYDFEVDQTYSKANAVKIKGGEGSQTILMRHVAYGVVCVAFSGFSDDYPFNLYIDRKDGKSVVKLIPVGADKGKAPEAQDSKIKEFKETIEEVAESSALLEDQIQSNEFVKALGKLTIPAEKAPGEKEIIELIKQFIKIYDKDPDFWPVEVSHGLLVKKYSLGPDSETAKKITILFALEKILVFTSQKEMSFQIQNKLKALISDYMFEGEKNVPEGLKGYQWMTALEYMKKLRLLYGTSQGHNILIQIILNDYLIPGLYEQAKPEEARPSQEYIGQFNNAKEIQEKIAELYYSGLIDFIVYSESLDKGFSLVKNYAIALPNVGLDLGHDGDEPVRVSRETFHIVVSLAVNMAGTRSLDLYIEGEGAFAIARLVPVGKDVGKISPYLTEALAEEAQKYGVGIVQHAPMKDTALSIEELKALEEEGRVADEKVIAEFQEILGENIEKLGLSTTQHASLDKPGIVDGLIQEGKKKNILSSFPESYQAQLLAITVNDIMEIAYKQDLGEQDTRILLAKGLEVERDVFQNSSSEKGSKHARYKNERFYNILSRIRVVNGKVGRELKEEIRGMKVSKQSGFLADKVNFILNFCKKLKLTTDETDILLQRAIEVTAGLIADVQDSLSAAIVFQEALAELHRLYGGQDKDFENIFDIEAGILNSSEMDAEEIFQELTQTKGDVGKISPYLTKGLAEETKEYGVEITQHASMGDTSLTPEELKALEKKAPKITKDRMKIIIGLAPVSQMGSQITMIAKELIKKTKELGLEAQIADNILETGIVLERNCLNNKDNAQHAPFSSGITHEEILQAKKNEILTSLRVSEIGRKLAEIAKLVIKGYTKIGFTSEEINIVLATGVEMKNNCLRTQEEGEKDKEALSADSYFWKKMGEFKVELSRKRPASQEKKDRILKQLKMTENAGSFLLLIRRVLFFSEALGFSSEETDHLLGAGLGALSFFIANPEGIKEFGAPVQSWESFIEKFGELNKLAPAVSKGAENNVAKIDDKEIKRIKDEVMQKLKSAKVPDFGLFLAGNVMSVIAFAEKQELSPAQTHILLAKKLELKSQLFQHQPASSQYKKIQQEEVLFDEGWSGFVQAQTRGEKINPDLKDEIIASINISRQGDILATAVGDILRISKTLSLTREETNLFLGKAMELLYNLNSNRVKTPGYLKAARDWADFMKDQFSVLEELYYDIVLADPEYPDRGNIILLSGNMSILKQMARFLDVSKVSEDAIVGSDFDPKGLEELAQRLGAYDVKSGHGTAFEKSDNKIRHGVSGPAEFEKVTEERETGTSNEQLLKKVQESKEYERLNDIGGCLPAYMHIKGDKTGDMINRKGHVDRGVDIACEFVDRHKLGLDKSLMSLVGITRELGRLPFVHYVEKRIKKYFSDYKELETQIQKGQKLRPAFNQSLAQEIIYKNMDMELSPEIKEDMVASINKQPEKIKISEARLDYLADTVMGCVEDFIFSYKMEYKGERLVSDFSDMDKFIIFLLEGEDNWAEERTGRISYFKDLLDALPIEFYKPLIKSLTLNLMDKIVDLETLSFNEHGFKQLMKYRESFETKLFPAIDGIVDLDNTMAVIFRDAKEKLMREQAQDLSDLEKEKNVFEKMLILTEQEVIDLSGFDLSSIQTELTWFQKDVPSLSEQDIVREIKEIKEQNIIMEEAFQKDLPEIKEKMRKVEESWIEKHSGGQKGPGSITVSHRELGDLGPEEAEKLAKEVGAHDLKRGDGLHTSSIVFSHKEGTAISLDEMREIKSDLFSYDLEIGEGFLEGSIVVTRPDKKNFKEDEFQVIRDFYSFLYFVNRKELLHTGLTLSTDADSDGVLPAPSSIDELSAATYADFLKPGYPKPQKIREVKEASRKEEDGEPSIGELAEAASGDSLKPSDMETPSSREAKEASIKDGGLKQDLSIQVHSPDVTEGKIVEIQKKLGIDGSKGSGYKWGYELIGMPLDGPLLEDRPELLRLSKQILTDAQTYGEEIEVVSKQIKDSMSGIPAEKEEMQEVLDKTEEPIITIIGEYIEQTLKKQGPGSKTTVKDLDQAKTTKVWNAVNRLHDERIEIFLPQSTHLTDEVEDAVVKMKKGMKENGKFFEVTRYRNEKLLGLLSENKNKAKRIVVTDDLSSKYIQDLLSDRTVANIFRDVKLLNVKMPKIAKKDVHRKTAYQAQMLMTAVLARLLEKGSAHELDIRVFLTDMLSDSFPLQGVKIGDFLDRLSQTEDQTTSVKKITNRMKYFLADVGAISLIKSLEIELRALKLFWTFA